MTRLTFNLHIQWLVTTFVLGAGLGFGCGSPRTPQMGAPGMACDGAQGTTCYAQNGLTARLQCDAASKQWTVLAVCGKGCQVTDDNGVVTTACDSGIQIDATLGSPHDAVPTWSNCGDGVCQSPQETPKNCSVDCGFQCGDGNCGNGEDCPVDCDGVGNGCQNPTDIALLQQGQVNENSAAQLSNVISNCTWNVSCPALPIGVRRDGCVAHCIEVAAGLSIGCARCFAQFEACELAACATQCAMQSDPQDCTGCGENANCLTLLRTCQAAGSNSPCGVACAPGRICQESSGLCVPGICNVPPPSSTDVQVVSQWQMAAPSLGCDLNGDGKIDNQFAAFEGMWTQLATQMPGAPSSTTAAYSQALATGSHVTLLAASAWNDQGKSMSIDVLDGQTPAQSPPCDAESGACSYLATQQSLDLAAQLAGDCPVLAVVTVANSSGTLYGQSAGIWRTWLPLPAPQGSSVGLAVHVQGLLVKADVTGPDHWLSSSGGWVCGVVTLAQLQQSVDALPANAVVSFGGYQAVKTMIGNVFIADQDTNGDGQPDAMSAAFEFTTAPASIQGWTK